MEDKIKSMIEVIREIKEKANFYSNQLRSLKKDLRIFMIDSGIDEYDDIEIRRAFSFDVELFRLEQPKLFEVYAVREEVTSFRNKMTKANKDKLQKDHPEIYKEYIEEKTAQLRGL